MLRLFGTVIAHEERKTSFELGAVFEGLTPTYPECRNILRLSYRLRESYKVRNDLYYRTSRSKNVISSLSSSKMMAC